MEILLWAAALVLGTSFLSNVSPFVGASYTLIATFELTALGYSPSAFLVVVVASAVGATAAKVVIYYGSFGLKGVLLRNRNVRLVGRFAKSRPFYPVLFFATLLPIFPFDDFIFIGAGATSSKIGLMTSVTLSAKLIKSSVEIWLEFTAFSGLASLLGTQSLLLTGIFTVAFVAIGIAVYSADWERIVARIIPKAVAQPGHAAKAL